MKPIIYATLFLSLTFSGICHASQNFTCSNNEKVECNDYNPKKVQYLWKDTVLCGCVKEDEVIHSFQDSNNEWHKITMPENTSCTAGWEAYSLSGESGLYHMLTVEPTICHEDIKLSNMKPEDYKETCYGAWVDNDGDAGSEQYDRCPEMQWEANIDLLTHWDAKEKKMVLEPTTNKACVAKNEEEFIKMVKLAAGTTYSGLDVSDGMMYDTVDDKQVEGCGENNPEDCTRTLNYFVKPAYWAFEHTCTVGVDESDIYSKPIAKYRFNEKGEIERQVYDEKKKEWGANQPISGKPAEWKKDGWQKDPTGWCANPGTYCTINKRIEVADGVKLSEPIVIDKQEQKTWPFRIEIRYKGNNEPKFPGLSLDPNDKYDHLSINGAPHEFIISGFDLTGKDFFGEMLPIYPDISNVSLTTTKTLFDKPVSPIFTANPSFGSGPVMKTMYEISNDKCKSEYGMDACYGVNFQYYEEGLTAIYLPDWVGIYLDNKFQFAACAQNLNETVFECDHSIILQTDPEFEAGIDKWFSKVIIPADKIKNNAKYQFVFNWFARPYPITYKDGTTQDVIALIKQTVTSPLTCAEGEAKFKGTTCIKASECAANNGFLKEYLGHDVCRQCAENETLINNSCANKYKLNTCEAENRVWGNDTCGQCKPGLTDIGDVCINTVAEEAACKAKPATHGKWAYSSTNNSCNFACDKGFIETANGICALKCDGNGLVPNSGETACTCDTANHWTPFSGGGCKCEDGYSPEGSVCVSTAPPGPDACGSDSECDDDEVCKDGKCQNEEPEPLGGECKANADCKEGHVCSSSQKCECDTANNWYFNNLTAQCEHYEPTSDTPCEDVGGYYYEIENRCVYDATETACLKSEGKWKEETCWHDPDGDGEWTPDTDLPPSNTGSGCGTISNASLPESLGSLLPYLLVIGIALSMRRFQRLDSSPSISSGSE